jgi:hypothetical protein
MRLSRFSLATIGVIGVALVALLMFAAIGYRQGPVVDGDRLAKALSEYVRDIRKGGKPLPSSITLDLLVRSGHLRAEDAKPFEGVTVVFHPEATETQPQSMLVEAWMPDGSLVALNGDGSVQQYSPRRYQEYRQSISQPGGATNASPSIR